MSKTRDTGFLANVIQVHDTGVRIMSGSEMLMAISSSGQVTITGELSGSDAANSLLLDGTGSLSFTTTASFLVVSASQQQISSSLLQVSASYISLSGSYTTFSGSASTRTTQIENVYATTGSNSFRADQSITGSLVVSSTITAQTLVVQTVTSSIVYSSGSNIFGSALTNTQTFTGSVLITGSLTIAGGSSASSYSGATIYGSTTVCSPVGYFSGCVGIGTITPTFKLEVQPTHGVGVKDAAAFLNIEGNNGDGAAIYIGTSQTTNQGNARIVGTAFSGNDYRSNIRLQTTTISGVWNDGLLIDYTGASTFSSTITGTTIYGSTAVCSAVGLFSGCVGIGQPNPQTTLEVNGGNTYFPAKIITLSGAEATRYNGFIGLNLIGGSQLGMSLGTRSNNVDYTNTLNLYQGNVGIGTNTTNPTEKLEMNVGSGTRLGMAITGEYPYIILNNSGSSSVNARSFALSLTSLEAGDFAIKMSNCKNGNPVADGFDPLRISRAGDTTITCTLTVSGCGLVMTGTGALTLPNGTTAQRPGSPSAGMIRYNNATNTTEYYNGCAWYALSDNYVHSVDMLMVSGGGGGGVNLSGAGGGGGVLYFSSFSLRPGIPITVIVGGGGAVGGQGNASCVFGNVLCGGQGASQVTFHRSGNSGFLASLANSNCYTSVSVYCNNLGGYASGNAGAGGAGAGAGGCNMSGNSDVSNKSTPGGNGIQVGTILDGVNNYYWAGGGGGEGYADYAGAGGCGGGGGGGSFAAYGTSLYPGCGGLGGLNPGCPGTVTGNALNGGAGAVNTGGGGGGGSHTGAGCTATAGGAGGSGIVILRYPQNYNPPTVTGTIPCICTYCGYRSYIFLSSGTITF